MIIGATSFNDSRCEGNPVNGNLPEEERDEENNDPQLQGATTDREVGER